MGTWTVKGAILLRPSVISLSGTQAKSLSEANTISVSFSLFVCLQHITLLDLEPVVREERIIREHFDFRSLLDSLHSLITMFILS